MIAKQLKITASDISGYTGLPLSTVWKHRRDGVLDMGSMESVIAYCVGYRHVVQLKERR